MRDIMSSMFPGSAPGPPPCRTCLEYLTQKVSRRHPNQMPEPQLAPFNVEKWQIYSGFSRMAEHLTLLLRESQVTLWIFRSQTEAYDHSPPWLRVGSPSFSGWRLQPQTWKCKFLYPPLQLELDTTTWWSQQDHIICQKQRWDWNKSCRSCLTTSVKWGYQPSHPSVRTNIQAARL